MLQFIRDRLPESLRETTGDLFPWAILGVGGLLALLIFWRILRSLLGSGRSKPAKTQNLEEDLTKYPPPKPFTGDRRLLAEGVPVRMRLVVIAAAGTESEYDEDRIEQMLDLITPGLGEVFRNEKPRVRTWPMQHSYQGFATHFHRNMLTKKKEGELSPWVLVAGRAKLAGKTQVMLGFALQALKPTTVGNRTVDAHEWPQVLRIRMRD